MKTYDELVASMPSGLDGLLKYWGLEQFYKAAIDEAKHAMIASLHTRLQDTPGDITALGSSTVGRESDKFMLRLPDGMREDIALLAKANNRSMNAEIVHRLQESFDLQSIANPGEAWGFMPFDKTDPNTYPEYSGGYILRCHTPGKEPNGPGYNNTTYEVAMFEVFMSGGEKRCTVQSGTTYDVGSYLSYARIPGSTYIPPMKRPEKTENPNSREFFL